MKSALAVAAVVAAMGMPGTVRAQAEPLLGQLMMVGFNFCPRGWANADGQLIAIAANSALFSLYGTTYGGDGRTTFALPDLRGRVPIHTGNGPGLSPYRDGQKGGSETNTITVAQMPSHTHTLRGHGEEADSTTPTGNALGPSTTPMYSSEALDTSLKTGSIQNTGGGQPVNNLQPYLTLRWCVALTGIYPSRN